MGKKEEYKLKNEQFLQNLTLQIAQLTDDYMQHNGCYVRVAAGGQNEAPTKIGRAHV